MTNPRRRINVISLDFDGCIFNRGYIYSFSPNRLIEHNQKFIDSVTSHLVLEAIQEAVLMVGSNRQDVWSDIENSRGKSGSCYPALLQLSETFAAKPELKDVYVHHNDFLMADIYGSRNHGESFQAAMMDEPGHFHFQWLFDSSKLTTLYAQMHKLASENPDAEIIFDFYDDRLDLLAPLSTFFKNNSDLVPDNLQLRLHEYEGEGIRDFAPIQGTLPADKNYQNNIWRMIVCAGLDYDAFMLNPTECDVMSGLTPDRLQSFKENRDKPYTPPVLTHAGGSVFQHRLEQEEYDPVFILEAVLGYVLDALDAISNMRLWSLFSRQKTEAPAVSESATPVSNMTI